jgi:tetratricopeptide (TPR) repeat protein
MPRATYGSQVKARALRLFEALLYFVNDELDECDRLDIKFRWQAKDSATPQLVIFTRLTALEELTKKDNYEGNLTKPQIREALYRMRDFLGILKDNRRQKRGSEKWHFTLTLFSKETAKNLLEFEQNWENKRPRKSKRQKETINTTSTHIEVERPLPGVEPTKIFQNLPSSGVIQFVGQDEALLKLHQLLQQCDRITDPDVVQNLNKLALLCYSQGWYAEAEPLYQKALELRQRLLGEEHPAVAQSLNNLANLYYSQERYAQAEPLYQQALELKKRLLGEEHPDIATSLNNLALLYYSQERYAEAESLYVQTLELRKRLLGEEHPDVAQSLSNLANLYYSQERYAEAEPLYLQALELKKHLLGEEHPDIAQSLNNLAALYYFQAQYAKAEPLYLQALDLEKRCLGEEHPAVAQSLNNLANLYKFQGRYAKAEPLYL